VLLHITPAERAALQLLADGRSSREIAERLRVSESRIEAHLRGLFAKMGASTRTEAVTAAVRRGLLLPESYPTLGRKHSSSAGSAILAVISQQREERPEAESVR